MLSYVVITFRARMVVIGLCVMGLSACATTEEESMVEAATSPFSDLNLVKKKIPDVLRLAVLDPYALPSDLACDAIESDVHELDDVLGIDNASSGNGMTSEGRKLAGGAAVDTVRRTTQGIMPMRDWVRKLSGAEKYSREVSEAISAGLMRRSFLHGYYVAKGCVKEDEAEDASEETK